MIRPNMQLNKPFCVYRHSRRGLSSFYCDGFGIIGSIAGLVVGLAGAVVGLVVGLLVVGIVFLLVAVPLGLVF